MSEGGPAGRAAPQGSRGSAPQVLLAFGALLLALVAAELAVRVLRPTPRAQVIEGSRRVELRLSEGVPVWTTRDDPRARPDETCRAARPGAAQVVGLGSSIFYGVELAPAQTWAPRVQALLDQAGLPTCVHNLSGPGFSALQKRQLLREVAAPLSPRVVLWELWGTDVLEYRMLGGRAWRMGVLRAGPDGYPNPLSLPLAVNRLLFDSSAAWRYATAAIAPAEDRPAGDWNAVLDGPVAEALALAERSGGQLLLVAMPPLDRSFAESADGDDRMATQAARWIAARAGRPVRLLRAAELLRGDDHVDLRLDDCCHYNEAGQARLAEVLAPHVEAALRASD